MDKPSGLLRKSVNYGRNKFYDTGPWFVEHFGQNLVAQQSLINFVLRTL